MKHGVVGAAGCAPPGTGEMLRTFRENGIRWLSARGPSNAAWFAGYMD